MERIQLIVMTMLVVMIVASVVSFLIFWSKRDESLYKKLLVYWGFQLLNMVVQGATKEASPILLASACLIWPALAQTVVLMYQDLYDIKIPRNRTIAVATVGSAIVMYGLYFVGMPFVVYANAPILLVAGMTFRYSWSAFQNISSNRVGRFLDYVFLFCNIVYILQTMTYPFSRLNPSKAEIGLFMHLCFAVSFAIFLPAVILKRVEWLHHRELRHKVEAQSSALINETKSSSLGVFSAEIAHQVNNPLTVALGKIRLERKNSDNKNLEDSFNAILKASNVLHAIKSLSASLENEPNKTDLTEVLNTFNESVEFALEGKRIRFRKSWQTTPCYVHCPRSVLVQVLLSLYNNAVKALEQSRSEDKYLEIKVDYSPYRVVMSFIDSAASISDEQKTSLFLPFRIEDKKTAAKGLSLPTVKLSLKQFGGDIKLVQNKGLTRFECSLDPVVDRYSHA